MLHVLQMLHHDVKEFKTVSLDLNDNKCDCNVFLSKQFNIVLLHKSLLIKLANRMLVLKKKSCW